MPKSYICAHCNIKYNRTSSDKECHEEYKKNFPELKGIPEKIDIICDDCYKKIMPWINSLSWKERDEMRSEILRNLKDVWDS